MERDVIADRETMAPMQHRVVNVGGTPGHRHLVAILLATALAMCATPAFAATAASGGVASDGFGPAAPRIIVKAASVASGAGWKAAGRPARALAGAPGGRPGMYTVAVRRGESMASALAVLRADPGVAWAEPDYLREPLGYTSRPNDPDFLSEGGARFTADMAVAHARSWHQRGVGSVNADAVWPYLEPAETRAYGARASSSAFTVGVIDTGLYKSHPDVGSNIVGRMDLVQTYTAATGVCTTDTDVTPADPALRDESVLSHGTCVAGAIAAATDNGTGAAGVGWDTRVFVYKVQGICVDGIPAERVAPGAPVILDSVVIAAIDQAVADGCKVINMSLGGRSPSVAMQSAVDHAYSHGVVVVAATGNDAKYGGVWYPAACENAIGVGSYSINSNMVARPTYSRSGFTNYGPGLDVLAPGIGVWGLMNPDAGSGYKYWSGTSMASPIVAGGIAALWRLAPSMGVDEVTRVALESSRDMGSRGYDWTTGWGAFDMRAARQAIAAHYPELVPPVVTARPSASTSRTTAVVSWAPVAGHFVTYRLTLDGAAAGGTSGGTYSFPSLPDGVHTVTITPTSSFNWWSAIRSARTVSFTVDTSAPAVPDVAISAGDVRWSSAEPGPLRHEVRMDGGTPVAVTGAASTLFLGAFPLSAGDHRVEVRSTDAAGNTGAWGAADFSWTPAASRDITMGAPVTVLRYGGGVVLRGAISTGGVPAVGERAVVQMSTDGVVWSSVASSGTDVAGVWQCVLAAQRTAWYRAAWFGPSPGDQVFTPAARVTVLPIVGTPATLSSVVLRGRAYTFTASLSPRHVAGSAPAQLRGYHWERRTVHVRGRHVRVYGWVLRVVRTMSVSGSGSSLSARTVLPYRGRWYVRVAYRGTSAYGAAQSATRRIVVR